MYIMRFNTEDYGYLQDGEFIEHITAKHWRFNNAPVEHKRESKGRTSEAVAAQRQEDGRAIEKFL